MKTVLLCLILFCVIAMPALGELTDADLDKIRLIVKEEINADRENFEKNILISRLRALRKDCRSLQPL